MLSEEQGIKAIIELQAVAGIVESEKQAKAGWNGFSDYEKENTEAAHKVVCGGFKDGEKPA